MELKPIAERFILHWGEMGSRGGVIEPSPDSCSALSGGTAMDAEKSLRLWRVAPPMSAQPQGTQAWRLCVSPDGIGATIETSLDVWELFN